MHPNPARCGIAISALLDRGQITAGYGGDVRVQGSSLSGQRHAEAACADDVQGEKEAHQSLQRLRPAPTEAVAAQADEERNRNALRGLSEGLQGALDEAGGQD
jgi:hypothetical protein